MGPDEQWFVLVIYTDGDRINQLVGPYESPEAVQNAMFVDGQERLDEITGGLNCEFIGMKLAVELVGEGYDQRIVTIQP